MSLERDIALKNYSYYKIGGPADFFLAVSNTEQLKTGLTEWKEDSRSRNNKMFILGAGTNILFSDDGFDGLIIKNNFNEIVQKYDFTVEFSSGLMMAVALQYLAKNSLSGLEWAGGLPGTIGGAIRGNAGAFGAQTDLNCIEVKTIDLRNFEICKFTNVECLFGYRDSFFKSAEGKNFMILSATFKFEKGEVDKIKEEVFSKIRYRKEYQPLEYPSLGSMFKNPELSRISKEAADRFIEVVKQDPVPCVPAAHLISEAGLKGKQIGGIRISEKHPNFFINVGDGTAKDVLGLIELTKRTVAEKFNIDLETEVMILK